MPWLSNAIIGGSACPDASPMKRSPTTIGTPVTWQSDYLTGVESVAYAYQVGRATSLNDSRPSPTGTPRSRLYQEPTPYPLAETSLRAFAAVEGRSMIVGAFPLAAYSWVVCVLLKKFLLSSWTATMAVSGSSLRLVYPRPCFNSHDRSVQAFRPKLRDHLTLSRNVLATARLCILT